MVQLINRGWRNALAEVAEAAEESLLVAAPYIKDNEAAWLCGLLSGEIEVLTLARMELQAIRTSALDVNALLRLANVSSSARLIALPNLHAKVFVADEKAAIITSGNLTRSGLDTNIEYGVVLRDPALVRTVRDDMLNFARLGNAVSPGRHRRAYPHRDGSARSGSRNCPQRVQRSKASFRRDYVAGEACVRLHAGRKPERQCHIRRSHQTNAGRRAADHANNPRADSATPA